MKVFSTNQQKNFKNMTVLQIDYQENPNYKKGIANKLATKPLKQ
jgi:hypothetical protein